MKITSKNDPDILDNKTVKKKENIRKNIGLLSKGQLNKKISEITGNPVKKNIKRNRNAKEGINKKNNYQYILVASRKTCHNCGNTNHLAIDCRKSKKKSKVILFINLILQEKNIKQDNPCSHCGSF